MDLEVTNFVHKIICANTYKQYEHMHVLHGTLMLLS